MKKIIFATLISGAMSASALAVDMGSGTVTFTGSIITAPCSIAPGEEIQNIPLGQVSNVTLEQGNMSSPEDFSIKLQGCNLQDNNDVIITFEGTDAGTDTGLLQITGDAKGAAVKIMNSSGTQIKINAPYDQKYVKGDNELKFSAALQGLEGATVVPGDFSATTRFTLKYE
ncbi:fimbrial protein [Providencia manganoxydans]|uniref:fimbrial protein n=1 Tax=Providencia manganoxydans TaxID=2923283 RepID=UPI0032DA4382